MTEGEIKTQFNKNRLWNGSAWVIYMPMTKNQAIEIIKKELSKPNTLYKMFKFFNQNQLCKQ
ncbi:MAG: hypothetical protein LBQ24_02560 [Candidatus Peribacteria bacterium]|jgi:hypothetical protein|nr:hypothetical protein [Candidatus Peribacteria bacterium]